MNSPGRLSLRRFLTEAEAIEKPPVLAQRSSCSWLALARLGTVEYHIGYHFLLSGESQRRYL